MAKRSGPLPMGFLGKTLLGTYLFVFGIGLIYAMMECWPSGAEDRIVFFGEARLSIPVTADLRLILLVMCAGGVGSWIHMATSFMDFAGNRRLRWSWFWWYLYRPWTGIALAVLFYFVLRAGLDVTGDQVSLTSPYTLGAVGGLVGLFARSASDKLGDVFDAVFRSKRAAERRDPLANPPPSVREVEPPTFEAGLEAPKIQVNGEGFVENSVVCVNGADRPTDYASDCELRASLEPEDTTSPGPLKVSVRSPAPGGGTSPPAVVRVI